MRPIFSRQGSKYYCLSSLLPLIPIHDTYIEPFVGSGSVFFGKDKAEKNVLNDLDIDLMNAYRLIEMCSNDISLYNHDLTTIEKIKKFYDGQPTTTEDKLTHYKIASSNGFNGKFVLKSKYIYKKNNPFTTLKHIQSYREKLENVVLSNLDYKETIKDHDCVSAFLFIDPPYTLFYDNAFAYAEQGDTFDYNELLYVLKTVKGKFMMTLNDTDFFRDLFKCFYITTFTTTKNNWKHIPRVELLISNYNTVSL